MATTTGEHQERDYVLGKAIHLATVAALGGFLFGFDTAVINGAVNAMREDFQMGSALTGFVVSSALLGCVLGAYLAGRLAERIGRIRVMVLASALFTASAIGSGLAFGAWDMIFWRVLGGVGVGAASVLSRTSRAGQVSSPSWRTRAVGTSPSPTRSITPTTSATKSSTAPTSATRTRAGFIGATSEAMPTQSSRTPADHGFTATSAAR